MTTTDDHETRVLEALTRAVAAALERKRRLGQYAVLWRDGRAVCVGPDAPLEGGASAEAPDQAAGANDSAEAPGRRAGGVAEPDREY